MQLIAIATSLFAVATASHAGHDHMALKPSGAFYGILAQPNRAGDKIWNNIEIQFDFKDASFDMIWWFGIRHPLVAIPKQTFRCSNIAYTFDVDNLRVVVNPDADACLTRINNLFPRGMGITNPFAMPVDHDSGDLTFAIVNNLIKVEMYAIDAPLASLPSGVDGFAPATTPGRRAAGGAPQAVPTAGAAPATAAPQQSEGPAVAGPTAAAAAAAVKDATTTAAATTTTSNSATARLGSVFVSAAAVIFAGLFL